MLLPKRKDRGVPSSSGAGSPVFCVFKASAPPTQHLLSWYSSRAASQQQSGDTFRIALPSISESKSEAEVGIMMLRRADNNPPTLVTPL